MDNPVDLSPSERIQDALYAYRHALERYERLGKQIVEMGKEFDRLEREQRQAANALSAAQDALNKAIVEAMP